MASRPHKSKDLRHNPTDMLAQSGFYIEIYHINSGKTVRFKAFMKDFNDIYNTSYDDQFFVGQTEPIKKWKSTVRQIDLSFAAVASGIAEARQNMAKVSLMTNMLYPEQQFDGDGRITKVGGSPIFKVRFLNLVAGPGMNGMATWGPAWETGLQGYIGNFMYRIDPENGIFFHAPSMKKSATRGFLSQPSGVEGQKHLLYPQEVTVSFTLYPVYERSPGWHQSADGMVFTINNSPISDSPYVIPTKEGETPADPKLRGAHAVGSNLSAPMGAVALPQLDEAAVSLDGVGKRIADMNSQDRALEQQKLASDTLESADAEFNAKLMQTVLRRGSTPESATTPEEALSPGSLGPSEVDVTVNPSAQP